ncbi:MAG: hypothetical protein QXQ37_06950 [Nitrososphaerota archaeon]
MVDYINHLISLYSAKLKRLLEQHAAYLEVYEAVILQLLNLPKHHKDYKKQYRLLLQEERNITKQDIQVTNEIDETMSYLDALNECLEFTKLYLSGNTKEIPKQLRGVFTIKNNTLVLSKIGLLSYCQGKYAEFIKIMRMSDEKYAKYIAGQHIFMGSEKDFLNISASSHVDENKGNEINDDNICI